MQKTAKNWWKLITLMLTLVLVVSVIPNSAFAADSLQGDTNGNGTVDVTITISEGVDGFYTTPQGVQLVKQELNIPYFDLDLYGLSGYYYNPDCYSGTQTAGTKEVAYGYVTTMHAFIYATERYVYGLDPEDCGKGEMDISDAVSWSGGVGSSFMKFWNGSTNLNYYLDYQFPLGRVGWGSTSDQQALTDGAAIDIHLIKADSVSGSQYSYFVNDDGTFDHGKVTEGETKTLTLRKTISSYGVETLSEPVTNSGVYYISVDDFDTQKVTEWKSLGTTNEDGQITIPNTLSPGKYYISCIGGVDGTGERGPAAYVLTVKEFVEFKYGDVNNDGVVNAYDASLLLQYAAGKLTSSDIVVGAADVSGDGSANAYDASLILQYAAGKITEFPVEK